MPRAARTVINHDGRSRCSGRGGDRQVGTKPAELMGAASYFTSLAREVCVSAFCVLAAIFKNSLYENNMLARPEILVKKRSQSNLKHLYKRCIVMELAFEVK